MITTKDQSQYQELSEREKQTQASFWALLFVVSELVSAYKHLAHLLVEKEILTNEDVTKLDQRTINPETLSAVYETTEKAFLEKYQRVRYAMENPERVEQIIKNQENNNDQGSVEGTGQGTS